MLEWTDVIWAAAGFGLGFGFGELVTVMRSKNLPDSTESSIRVETRLDGLTQQIQQFWQILDQKASSDLGLRTELRTQLQHLIEVSQQVSKTTNALEGALRGDVKTQGEWGELVLERVLEASGLKQGREYHSQMIATGAEGERLRPDVVIRLPNKKCLIIDSKVTVSSLFSGANSEEEADQSEELVALFKRHIQTLANRNYGSLEVEGLSSPELVFMFVPLESVVQKVLSVEPEILEWALRQNVAIVTPSTLMSALKIASQLWQQDRQNQNTEAILDLATRLCDRVIEFTHAVERANLKVEEVQSALEKMRTQLSDGRAGIVAPLKKLRELGLQTKKELPSRFDSELSERT